MLAENMTNNYNTKESATLRSQKLQDRLVKLSVGIDDKVKAIDLLSDAIVEQDRINDTDQKETKAQYRVQFESNAEEHKGHLAQLLDSCSKAVRQKEESTSEIEHLMKRKGQEEKITAAFCKRIHRRIKKDISQAFDAWKGGEDERQRTWIGERVKKVRNVAVRALQPQVKNLLLTHKSEILKIEAEMETRKRYIKEENATNLEKRLTLYTKSSKEKLYRLSEEEKVTGFKQIKQLQDQHSQKIESIIMHKFESERDECSVHQTEELKMMNLKHRDNLRKIETTTKDRLQKIREATKRKLEALHEGKLAALNDITGADAAEKQNWEDGVRMKLHESKVEDFKVLKEKILKDRDSEIDQIIRLTQREEANVGDISALETNDINDDYIKEHNVAMECTSQRITHLKHSVSQSISRIEYLNSKHQSCCEKLTSEERRVGEIEKETVEFRNHRDQFNADMASLVERVEKQKHEAIEGHLDRRIKCEREIKEIVERSQNEEREHLYKTNSMMQEHKTKLDVMQEDVKESIRSLDLNMLETNDQIHDEGVRLEKVKEILIEYTVQTQTDSKSEGVLSKKSNKRNPSYSRQTKR